MLKTITTEEYYLKSVSLAKGFESNVCPFCHTMEVTVVQDTTNHSLSDCADKAMSGFNKKKISDLSIEKFVLVELLLEQYKQVVREGVKNTEEKDWPNIIVIKNKLLSDLTIYFIGDKIDFFQKKSFTAVEEEENNE